MGDRGFSFYPIQPEMKSNSQLYLENQPKGLLKNEVILFYQLTTGEHTPAHLPVIPDGCLDLLFCCDPSHPFAILATSPESRCLYHFKPNCVYFGVRLFPEQTLLTLPCSIKELIQHQQIPLFEMVQFDSSLLENMVRLQSFPERIKWFISFFQQKQQETNYDQNLIKYCLNSIYATNGIIHINQLASDTGYSSRYLQRKFEEYIGFSPKQLCQIIRLQYTIQELLHRNQLLNTVIDDFSFYDKSHFYKGFKKYMNLTPKQYINTYKSVSYS